MTAAAAAESRLALTSQVTPTASAAAVARSLPSPAASKSTAPYPRHAGRASQAGRRTGRSRARHRPPCHPHRRPHTGNARFRLPPPPCLAFASRSFSNRSPGRILALRQAHPAPDRSPSGGHDARRGAPVLVRAYRQDARCASISATHSRHPGDSSGARWLARNATRWPSTAVRNEVTDDSGTPPTDR